MKKKSDVPEDMLRYCEYLRKIGSLVPRVSLMSKFGVNRRLANKIWKVFEDSEKQG